jgi:hypothetical protein
LPRGHTRKPIKGSFKKATHRCLCNNSLVSQDTDVSPVLSRVSQQEGDTCTPWRRLPSGLQLRNLPSFVTEANVLPQPGHSGAWTGGGGESNRGIKKEERRDVWRGAQR